MKIVFDKSVNAHVRAAVSQPIGAVEDLFPDWCSQVVVFWDEDSSKGYSLACRPNYHYRFVQIFVYPAYLNDADQVQTLIHEIHHCIMSPYVEKAEEIINHFLEDGATRQYIFSDLRKAEEAAVQDLTKLVGKLDTKYGPSEED